MGSGKWLLGPAAIFVYAPGRTVLGLVVENLWSVGGSSERSDVNELRLRPLFNLNLPRGWFITSKPNILANWEATGDARWLDEAGGGIGKVFRIGRLGISLESQFFGYPVKPEAGPRWSMRFEIKILFRRGRFVERVRERGRLVAPEPGAE